MNRLPIDDVLPALRQALAERHEAVLEAPPGAGKTTRVPLALLGEPWLAGQSILMLEPRRLAARAAAERLASELGEKVGVVGVPVTAFVSSGHAAHYRSLLRFAFCKREDVLIEAASRLRHL